MKKLFLAALGLLFLASTGMALADAASPSSKAKTVKSHKKHKKAKVALNPQPLPPDKVPVDGASTGNSSPQGGPKADKAQ